MYTSSTIFSFGVVMHAGMAVLATAIAMAVLSSTFRKRHKCDSVIRFFLFERASPNWGYTGSFDYVSSYP